MTRLLALLLLAGCSSGLKVERWNQSQMQPRYVQALEAVKKSVSFVQRK